MTDLVNDDDALSKDDLLEILETLFDAKDKAYYIGLALNLPPGEVKSICNAHKDPQECLTAVIEFYLRQVKPRPSWRAIAVALRHRLVNFPRIAENVESTKLKHLDEETVKYEEWLNQFVLSQDNCSMTPTDITAKIIKFEDRFNKLKWATRQELIDTKVPVVEVVDALADMPTDKIQEYKKFLDNTLLDLYDAQDQIKLFAKLSKQMNYLSYGLIDYLVGKFNMGLKEEMEAYKADLKQFRVKVPLETFCETQTKRHIECPEGFVKMVARFKWPKNITLEVVEQFRKEYAFHYNLCDCAMMVAEIRLGSSHKSDTIVPEFYLQSSLSWSQVLRLAFRLYILMVFIVTFRERIPEELRVIKIDERSECYQYGNYSNCATCYQTLVHAIVDIDVNKYNLSQIFFPRNEDEPEDIEVLYYTNGSVRIVFVRAERVKFLNAFQYSLFFSNTTSLTLSLPSECLVNELHLAHASKRLKTYAEALTAIESSTSSENNEIVVLDNGQSDRVVLPSIRIFLYTLFIVGSQVVSMIVVLMRCYRIKVLRRLKHYETGGFYEASSFKGRDAESQPRGADIVAETEVEVPPDQQMEFHWRNHGFHINIPAWAFSYEKRITLRIQASVSGEYQFPDDGVLVSGVYWLSLHPPVKKFNKNVTITLQHCASCDDPKLTFVTAHCTQKTLPYSFKPVSSLPTFKPGTASILMKHFSAISATGTAETYVFHSFYFTPRPNVYDEHITVTKNIEIQLQDVERKYNQWESGPCALTSLKEDTVSLYIPEVEGVPEKSWENNGWKLTPLVTPPTLHKRILDGHEKGKSIPCFALKLRLENVIKPKVLEQHIGFTGVDPPTAIQIIRESGLSDLLPPSPRWVESGHTRQKDVLSKKPTIRKLMLMEYITEGVKQKKVLRVLDKISPYWIDIASSLRVDEAVISDARNAKTQKQSARTVMSSWLKCDVGASWSKLIRAMRVVSELNVIRKELKTALLNPVSDSDCSDDD